jgi:hypothetical protein
MCPVERLYDEAERRLVVSLARHRQDSGDDAAALTARALAKIVEFVHAGGRGNVTLSVKDGRLAPTVRIECFQDVSRGSRILGLSG